MFPKDLGYGALLQEILFMKRLAKKQKKLKEALIKMKWLNDGA